MGYIGQAPTKIPLTSADITDGTIALADMASQSVDEDNLHISNSGSNGQFLSKQSGDTGGLTWAAAGLTGITDNATEMAITISSDEEVTIPKQPSFLAYVTGSQLNATGDGTTVNVATYTEVFDTNADFNASTGVFTAPVTGIYMFVMVFRVTGITSGMAMDFGMFTSNNLFNHLIWTGSAGPDAQVTTAIADMDASDTANMRLTCSAGAKVADIIGSATSTTSFSGFLLG